MKFEGGYDDGYPDGPQEGMLDIRIQRQMTLSDFMRLVTKVSAYPIPNPPPDFDAKMAKLAEEFEAKKENKFEMDERKRHGFAFILYVVSQRNGADQPALLCAVEEYAKLMAAPRPMWAHFMLDLGTFSYACDDMAMGWMSKKYNLPANHWTEQPQAMAPVVVPVPPGQVIPIGPNGPYSDPKKFIRDLYNQLMGDQKETPDKDEEEKGKGEEENGS